MASPFLQRRGTYWVIVQRGSNRVLSRHRSRRAAEQLLPKAPRAAAPAKRARGRK